MWYIRKSLRNKNIDYRKGRYFVTIQVALNKYLLGAIVGTQCVLNELGKSVETELVNLSLKYPELRLGPYVIFRSIQWLPAKQNCLQEKKSGA